MSTFSSFLKDSKLPIGTVKTIVAANNVNTLTYYGAYFDGVGDYLSVADNNALDLSGDFTIECWFYWTKRSGATSPRILSKGDYQIASSAWYINLTEATGSVTFGFGNPANSNNIGSVVANSWNHIAVSRSGLTIRLFLNGKLTNTVTSAQDFTSSYEVRIGAGSSATANEVFCGYISNVRIVKGTALYTGNFSLPTEPLEAVSGTSLLAVKDATFVDRSANNFTITKVGDTRIASDQVPPFTGNIKSTLVPSQLSDNGTWIKAGATYSQSAWPTLFNQLGYVNAQMFSTVTSGTTSQINSAAYGNGFYVYGGASGALASSTNGVNWVTRISNTTSTIYGLGYGAGLFVYVGAGGVLETSTDSLTWSNYSSNRIAGDTYASAYGNNLNAIVGAAGAIRTSTDKRNWTSINTGTSSTFYAVTYGSNGFTAGGAGGVLFNSTNGTSWTSRTSNTTSTINYMVYGAGSYVYAGAGGVLETSTDGTTWSNYSGTRITGDTYASAYGNNLNVMVGAAGVIRTSTDKRTWTNITTGTTSIFYAATYGAGGFAAGGVGGVLRSSTDGVTWATRTSNTSSTINYMSYGAGLYVYVGAGGTLETSTDGITWTNSNRITNDIYMSAYGNNINVAVGSSGLIRTSTDKRTWTTITSGTSSGIYAATYGNNGFAVSGAGGVLLTSTNGVTWTSRTSNTSSVIYQMVSGLNRYVYVGAGGVIETSTDSVTWTNYSSTRLTTDFYGSVYSNGLYVLVGASGSVRTTTDKKTWVTRTSGTSSTFYYATNINNTFIATGAGGALLTSTDSVTWTSRTTNTSSLIYRIAYGLEKYVYVSAGGVIETSTNLITWTNNTPSRLAVDTYGVSYGAGLYVVTGPTGQIRTSTDKLNWTTRTSGTSTALTTITYSNNLFLAGGAGGTLLTSTNAITWTSRTSNTSSAIYDISYYNNLYVCAGAGGMIETSTDSVTWTNYSSTRWSTDVYGVVYSGGLYVMVGASGSIRTSTDKKLWVTRTSGTSSALNSVINGNSLFVTGGASGVLLTSTDATTWTSRTSGTSTAVSDLSYGAGKYVMVGAGGMIRTSTDAITWAAATSNTTTALNRITYGNGNFVAVGDVGTIRTSTDAVTWNSGTASSPISGSYTNYYAVSYGNGLYVLLGGNSLGGNSEGSQYYYARLRVSVDGINWNSESTVFNYARAPQRLVYGNGNFVWVGNAGTMYTSTNGTTWAAKTTLTGSTIYNALLVGGELSYYGVGGALAYSSDLGANWYWYHSGTSNALRQTTYKANGLFVVVGDSGTIRTSTDLSIWKYVPPPSPRNNGVVTSYYGIAYGNGFYLAVGNNSQGSSEGTSSYLMLYRVSPDGITWGGENTITNYARQLQSMVYSDGTFFMVGNAGTMYTTTDSGIWTTKTSYTSSTIYRILSADNEWSYYGAGGALSFSKDTGNTWYSYNISGTTADLYRLVYANGVFVAAGNGVMRTSTDLNTWQYRPAGIVYWGLAYGNGTYVAVGNNSTDGANNNYSYYKTSTDGINWISDVNFTGVYARTIQTMEYSDGVFVIVGNAGTMYTSINGSTWSGKSTLQGGSTHLYTSQYIDGELSYYGTGGVLAYSKDLGDSWYWYTSGTTAGLYRIIYNNGLFITAGAGVIRTSTDLDTWQYKPNTSITYWGLAYGNGTYVAVGNSGSDAVNGNYGYYKTSTDGLIWSADVGFTGNYARTLQGLSYLNGVFTAVGLAGTMFTTPNGINWATKTSFTTSNIYSLNKSSDELFMGGAGGLAFYTDNGTNWYSYNSGTSNDINSINYAGGRFVCAANGGTIRSSPDGIKWYTTDPTSITYYGAVYGNGLYVAVGNNSSDGAAGNYNYYKTSTDAINWGPDTTFTAGSARLIQDLNFINNTFVCVGYGGSLFTSTDTVTWIARTSHTASNIYNVSKLNNELVLQGASGMADYSTDGIGWYSYNSGIINDINSINYTNGRFVFAANNGLIRSSTDGVRWTGGSIGTVTYQGAIYGNGLYVAVGNNSTDGAAGNYNYYRTSTDAVTWGTDTAFTAGSARLLQDLNFINSTFVCAGYGGSLYTSTNGITWTARTSPTVSNIYTIIRSNDELFMAGVNGTMNYTKDGAYWYSYNSGTVGNINNLSYLNGQFVATGDGGYIRTSTDGNTWMSAPYSAVNYTAASYGNGIWIVAGTNTTDNTNGNYGYYRTSTDGVNWSATGNHLANYARRINKMEYGLGQFVSVGNGGTLYTTTDSVTWNTKTSGTTSNINSILYHDSAFTYIGNSGAVARSTDATTWYSKYSSLSSINSNGLTYGNGVYVVVGDGGAVGASNNLAQNQRSLIFDASSEFYVPAFVATDDGTPESADTNLSNQAIQVVYVKARMT